MQWFLIGFLPLCQAAGVSGVVRGTEGEPLEGVTVLAYDLRLGYASATTNSTGEYSIAALPEGYYRLRAMPPDVMNRVERYWPADITFCMGELVPLDADEMVEGVDFSLPTGAVLQGRLLGADGEPLGGAEIEAEALDGEAVGLERDATTAEDGSFQLLGLQATATTGTSYVLSVKAEDYPAQLYGGVYDEEDATPVVAVDGEIVDLGEWGLLGGIVVSGQVTGPDGPVEGAAVHVYSEGQVVTEVADEEGGYQAWGLPPGSVLPWCSADGLATTYYPDTDRPEGFIDAFEEGQEVEGADMWMVDEAVFQGRLLGDGDLSAATVLLYNDENTVGWGIGLDADGSFALDSLHGGDYTLFLYASDEGYLDDYVRDEEGEVQVFHVVGEQVNASQDVELPLGATLVGTVVDDLGQPVHGAYVYATETETGEVDVASTDSDGDYELAGLPAGVYQIKARYSPYCDADPGWVTVYWSGTVNELLAGYTGLAGGERYDAFDFVLPIDDDQDEMGDLWEQQYGLDTSRDDSQEDPDGDGYTNLEEYRLGMDPTSASSGADRACGCSAAGRGGWVAWCGALLGLALRRRGSSVPAPARHPHRASAPAGRAA